MNPRIPSCSILLLAKRLPPLLFMVPCLLTSQPQAYLEHYVGGKAGALSLTFDDSLASHWTTAAPAMTARGMRGTFFVITGNVDWDGARSAALGGHEIASHSTTDAKHVSGDPAELVADAAMKLEQSRTAIDAQIGQVIPDYQTISFAYPYGITSRESDSTNLPDLVSQYFQFSRTAGGSADHNHPDPDQWAYRWDGAWRFGYQGGPRPDLAYHWISRSLILNGAAGEATTIANHLDTYAIGQNRWSVFLYHTEGGEANFTQHLDAIAARAEDLWIAPFGEVARYIQQRSKANLSVSAVEADSVTLSLISADGPDPDAVALSVSVVWPVAATVGVTVEQGGQVLAHQQSGDTFTFAAMPDGGDILVSLGGGSPAPQSPPVLEMMISESGLAIAFTSTGPAQHTLESSPLPAGPYSPVADIDPVTTSTAGQAHTFETGIAPPAPGDAVFFRIAVEP